MPRTLLFVCAGALLLGLSPLPHGYYTFLRLISCTTFALATYVSLARKATVFPTVYGILALLFNPFIPVHLPKAVWMFLDSGSALVLIATAWILPAAAQRPDDDKAQRIAS